MSEFVYQISRDQRTNEYYIEGPDAPYPLTFKEYEHARDLAIHLNRAYYAGQKNLKKHIRSFLEIKEVI